MILQIEQNEGQKKERVSLQIFLSIVASLGRYGYLFGYGTILAIRAGDFLGCSFLFVCLGVKMHEEEKETSHLKALYSETSVVSEFDIIVSIVNKR